MRTVDEEIKQENVELRRKYLTDYHCYSSAEIQELASSGPSDSVDYASLWKQQQKIFSINSEGVEVFPSFQFRDGKPLEVISYLLTQMPKDMTSWQIAFWFISGNGYLDGETPQDCLGLKDDLSAAVQALSQEVIG